MPNAPTFNTQTAEQCQCQNLSKTGWGVQSLLFLGGLSILCGMAYLLVQLMPQPLSALPPTVPAAKTSFASPSATVEPSPTPDPFAPTSTPAILLVMEVTRTPVPTPTLSPYEATLIAGQATATWEALPTSCLKTTPTPGKSKLCYWPTVMPTPTELPTFPVCVTPQPATYCQKEG